MHIVDYQVVESYTADGLREQVLQKMLQGLTPFGSVCVTSLVPGQPGFGNYGPNCSFLFCQAMVLPWNEKMQFDSIEE